MEIDQARGLFDKYRTHSRLHMCGVHLHIGSPGNEVQPYVDTIGKALALIEALRGDGHDLNLINIGGGYGATYGREESWLF